MSRHFSGTRLETLRGRKTQTDLANGLRSRGFGTTQTTVSRWESGQMPHSSVLPALAAELGCSVDELFADSDDAEAAQPMSLEPLTRDESDLLVDLMARALAFRYPQWAAKR